MTHFMPDKQTLTHNKLKNDEIRIYHINMYI